jgi:endonuclease/exonuclease/phosphatase family metal-dependent hydrolase
MNRLALLAAAAVVGLAACPGTNRDLSQPSVDAETDPPDAAQDVVAGPPVPVRLLTWNVRNLYNDVKDSPELSVADEMILTTTQYQTKLDDIGAVLGALTPDIAVLQEVENQNVLSDLGKQLPAHVHRHITQGNDPRGIDIALLSRHPIDLVVSHKAESFSSSATGQSYAFARDVLEAHFTINGRRLIVLGIHFKSGSEPESQDKRLAEAEQTRRLVSQQEELNPAVLVVVLGDFNAVPGSPPLAALAGAPPATLVSATAGLQATDRFSVTYGGIPQLFDDQLVDPDAFAALDPASVKIEHGSAVNAVSDHDPVVATYLLQ